MLKTLFLFMISAGLISGCATSPGDPSSANDPSAPTWNDTNYRNMMLEQQVRAQQIETAHPSGRR